MSFWGSKTVAQSKVRQAKSAAGRKARFFVDKLVKQAKAKEAPRG